MLQMGSPCSITDNIDVMSMILSFLSRKNKFLLGQVSRDFYNLVVPRSMVSLRIQTNPNVYSKWFSVCLNRLERVSKWTLEDIKVTEASAEVLCSSIACNAKFLGRLEELDLRDI